MKAISLHQPWASLIMLGEKRIETRDWCPPRALLGERIAIHAAKRIDECVLHPPFSRFFPEPYRVPLGALLGSVVLDSAWQIDRTLTASELLERNGAEHERVFGDYTPGRFAWLLRDVRVLEVPIPFRGAQRWFDVPEPPLGSELGAA
jgi:activating signal cointegrator 1